MGVGDGAVFGDGGAGQGVVGQAVDFAGHALGGLEQGFDGRGLEQGQLTAGQAQAMGQIIGQLVTGQAGEVVAYGLEQAQVIEIDLGVDEADPIGAGGPALQGGLAAQAMMRGAVILALEPGAETAVEGLEAGGFLGAGLFDQQPH